MKFRRYRFSPPWWGVALFLVGATLFCSLGFWQIQRAHTKEGLVAEQQASRRAGTQTMQPDRAAASGNSRNADLAYAHDYRVSGRFQPQRQILLSDQLHGTRTGYRVWTPLVLDNGIRVMVDRGWVPRAAPGQARPNPQAPQERVQVEGFWVDFPQPPVAWGASTKCTDRPWPRVLSTPGAAAVRCQYSASMLNGLLLLDPNNPHGFVREWDDQKDTVGLSPFGHYAYASQWFLMAFVAGVILVVVNLRRAR